MSPSGFIRADSGLNVYFDASAVSPPSGAALCAGQAVTFDLDDGKWPAAINVRLAAQQQAAPIAPQKTSAGDHLQYMGFEQTGSLRAYRFKRILRGEETREFIVNADLSLFVRHRVGIQEGPALSLRLLSAVPSCSPPAAMPAVQALSDVDMLAHLARRPPVRPGIGRKPNPDSDDSAQRAR